ncbi:MAG: hypothetical protein MN733_34875, partial [Nitrososphaera sp.]|nr:hypothetical protein [Nitrososphaera sp.]
EFHSKVSILRLIFKKIGYEQLTVEVNAAQESVLGKLATVELVLPPQTHKDTRLRSLQERLNPALREQMIHFIEANSSQSLELAHPLQFTDLDGKITLKAVFRLTDSNPLSTSSTKERNEEVLKIFWRQLSQSFVIPIAPLLRKDKGIGAIAMEVHFAEKRILFGVDSRVEIRTEMQCVAGTKLDQRWNPCKFTDQYGCKGGYDTLVVPDPCVKRAPATMTELKIDPQTQTLRDHARARFIVPLDLLNMPIDPEVLYDKIAVSLIDSKGEQVVNHGKDESHLNQPMDK